MTKQIEISPIEVLALKKLSLINGALAKQLTGTAAREQTALLSVLIDVINRAELTNAIDDAEAEEKLTVGEAWTILCETPDITSPEEYPDHALITMEQLGSFMARAAAPSLLEALEQIVITNQVREFMGNDKSDGYGDEGWVVRDGQYAKIARVAIAKATA